MGRRRKGQSVHGWLVFDKPADMGSTEAVAKLRWLFDAQKAGHAGTLDPLATGILPIAFGEATKTVPYIQDGRKTYRFTACWGAATATDDREGPVIATAEARPDAAAVQAILPQFLGTIIQRPPAFSAVRIDGARAYDLAREGETVIVPERAVTIERLDLISVDSADAMTFEAVTGKGTYVRALVRDLALALGTVGHVGALRRTAVGPFTAAMAVRFEDMIGHDGQARLTEEDRARLDPDAVLTDIADAFADLAQVSIGRAEAARLSSGGAAILAPPRAIALRAGSAEDIEPVLALEDDRPIAVCRLEGLTLKPVKVFNFAA